MPVCRRQPTLAAILFRLCCSRLSIRDSAVYYLTPAQLAAVQADLEEMEQDMSFEFTAYVLFDCLQRLQEPMTVCRLAGADSCRMLLAGKS